MLLSFFLGQIDIFTNYCIVIIINHLSASKKNMPGFIKVTSNRISWISSLNRAHVFFDLLCLALRGRGVLLIYILSYGHHIEPISNSFMEEKKNL